MSKIHDFEKIRRDGKIIGERMTARDVISLGWSPEKIDQIRWINEISQVHLNFVHGVLAKVVEGGNYVALIEEMDDLGQVSELWILNADGSKKIKIQNTQEINGRNIRGDFGWFEPPRNYSPDVFGVIYGDRADSSAFQLDIDAKSGKIIGIYPTR